MTRSHIERLLKPRSVAIVGASDKPGALGAFVLGNLQRNRFAGEIYPINPKRDLIAGLHCLASPADLLEGVDVAVLAIPRPAVLETLAELAARKVGAAIIFSAGFAEEGEAGKADQAEIARISQASGMIVEGPNCLGSVNYVDGIPLTFVETDAVSPAGRPAIAVVSQSGAMAAVLATSIAARGIPTSYTVSTGNEAASGVEDYVEWLIDDPDTHAVAMVVEHFRNPARFLDVARRARDAGKPILLLHPGRSSAARQSAATHTGAMVGDYKLMRVKVGQAGVLFAETLDELVDMVDVAITCPAVPGPGLAVLGESGAFKALTLDLCEELGVALAPLDDGNAPALRAALPSFVPVGNPLDITAQGLSEPSIYTHCLEALLDDDRVGCIVAGIIETDSATANIKLPPIRAAIAGRTLDKPVVYATLDEGAPSPVEHLAALRAAGIACLPNPQRAIRAIARLSVSHQGAVEMPEALAVPGLDKLSGVVPEYRAKALLAPLGIAFPAGGFAASADAAVSVAERIGYPVAMKAQAAALGHKSDAGGVLLNLADADAVRRAWSDIHSNVAAYDSALALDGVLIEAMGARGTELIVGGRNDPEWGPVVMVGFGGVQAEILQDVRLILPDMSEAAIKAELDRLRSAPLLHGYRGAPALDVAALVGLTRKLGAILSSEPRIAEIDLNPVILYPDGQGVVALDALMLLD